MSMFITNGKILIHQYNNPEHVEEAIEKIQDDILERSGREVTLEMDEKAEYPTVIIPKGVTVMDIENALRPHLQFRAINEDILVAPDRVNINTKYIYDEDDLGEIATDLSRKILEKHKLENEKARVMKEYKTKIDEIDSKINELAESHAQGYTYKDHACLIKYNFADKMKYYIDFNQRETIHKTEPMEPKDFQMKIDHTPEKLYLHGQEIQDEEETEPMEDQTPI